MDPQAGLRPHFVQRRHSHAPGGAGVRGSWKTDKRDGLCTTSALPEKAGAAAAIVSVPQANLCLAQLVVP